MKRILFGTLVTLFTIPTIAQPIQPSADVTSPVQISPPAPSAVDLLLKQTCGSIVALAENRIAEAKTKLAEVEASKARMMTDFVYPQAVLAGLNFEAGAPKIFELFSPETVDVATKYNMLSQQIDNATNIPETMRPEMKRELMRTYGAQLATLIAQDLAPILDGGRTMKNGNRVEDSTMSWGIYYAPTEGEPALSIHHLKRIQNFEDTQRSGKKFEPMSSVTVTVEMHYNPFTKTFSHIATSPTKEDVEPMFVRSNHQLRSGYFFFTDNIEETAKSQIEYASKDASYIECKKLK